MLEAPSRVERLPEPLGPVPGAAVATPGPVWSASRTCGWSVTLASPSPLTPSVEWLLSFRNYYAASVRVDLVLGQGTAVTVVDGMRLMRSLFCEDDAQNWHVVKLALLPSSTGSDGAERTLVGVRVYCRQPSPLWAKWELHSLKLFQHETPPSASPSLAVRGTDGRGSGVHRASVTKTVERSSDDPDASASSSAPTLRDRGVLQPVASVDGQAARCLDLVLQLRQLVTAPSTSSF